MTNIISSILNFFRDGLTGIVISIFLFLLQNRKQLNYEILVKENLMEVAKTLVEHDDIKIMYHGVEITNLSNLYLINIKFINSGYQPINPSDYGGDIDINFGEKSKILGIKKLGHKPNYLEKYLDIEINQNKKNLIIKPVLLNQNYYFIIQVLVTEFTRIQIDALIAGVEKIRKINTSESKNQRVIIIGGFILACLILALSICGILLFSLNNISNETIKVDIIASKLIIGLIALLTFVSILGCFIISEPRNFK
jgi:hypothetical protein